jgi:hypothetical protein
LNKYLLGVVALVGPLAACGGSKPEPIDNDGGDGGKEVTDGGSKDASDGSDAVSAPDGFGDATLPEAGPDGGAVVACTTESLVGSWEEVDTPGEAITVTFKSDGTYTAGIFVAAATPGDFYEEEAIGTYTISDAVLTLTPTEVTCPVTFSGGINLCYMADGDFFVHTENDFTLAWSPNTSTVNPSAITTGCSVNGGSFTPYPLMPVP